MKLIKSKKGYLDPGNGKVLLKDAWIFLLVLFLTISVFIIRLFWKLIKAKAQRLWR